MTQEGLARSVLRVFFFVVKKNKTYTFDWKKMRQGTPPRISRFSIALRKLQQNPKGRYARPSTTCLWRTSFHMCILGYVGYVPGVCWNFLRIASLVGWVYMIFEIPLTFPPFKQSQTKINHNSLWQILMILGISKDPEKFSRALGGRHWDQITHVYLEPDSLYLFGGVIFYVCHVNGNLHVWGEGYHFLITCEFSRGVHKNGSFIGTTYETPFFFSGTFPWDS